MILRSRASIFASLVSALAITSCGATRDGKNKTPNEVKVEVKPTVVTQAPLANATITDGSQSIRVLGGAAVSEQIKSGRITALTRSSSLLKSSIARDESIAGNVPGASQESPKEESLYIQLPTQLLSHGHLFGGVITTVSAFESDTLGRLKLTDLPPIHVRPYVTPIDGESESFALALVGCVQKCSESSEQGAILGLPILGQTQDGSQLVMDVSKFGETLNLMEVLDPNGEYSGLKTIATRTTAVDMSNSTIVWDVEHKMIPKDSTDDQNAEVTLIVGRYYLKLESSLNSSFVSRKQVDGVGYFTTSRGSEELITRFSQTEFNGKPIHYFIKNVPAEHKEAFAASFDDWNKAFSSELGRELITYEFLEANDPKNDLVVAGDVRFNVLEWDLLNQAPYGGLGPSIASQTTGEIFSANTLVQGPAIIKIYKEWFKVSALVQELRQAGKTQEAEKLLVETRRELLSKIGRDKVIPMQKLSLGSAIDFQIRAQDERLQDRIASRQDFFDIPQGETYESYMRGYFIDLVSHELGHNLGLRHNFKGNLLATADGSKPSGSIMEYLNREFRHKDTIGQYDYMAIKVGYAGAEPTRRDIFCTDEDVVGSDNPTFSAECSRDDATNNSFAYFARNLDRALDRIVAPTSDQAPTWLVADLNRELGNALTGQVAYATSAAATSKSWLNWKDGRRPVRASAISNFVLNSIKSKVCAQEIRNAPDKKATLEAKEATIKNLADLDAQVSSIAESFKLGTRLTCGS